MNKIELDVNELLRIGIGDLLTKYPFVEIFLKNNGIELDPNSNRSMSELFESLDPQQKEDLALDQQRFAQQLGSYIEQMLSFLGGDQKKVESLTILPGHDKAGNVETFEQLRIRKNEVVSIVGPTGSGKSRLLADIEWAAQNDTPTGRSVLINGETPDRKWRYSSSEKLVAQLSQNMNFVMDLTVREFLELHAESRMVKNQAQIIDRIIDEGNKLAGEKFEPASPITALSGGQSRALMIADTAVLSGSPIILIDEIENAGIDRKKALNLLLAEEKIVLIATHDPALALLGDRRVVIKNGGIYKVIETTEEEKSILTEIERLDKRTQELRRRLRNGEKLIHGKER
ncbi:MAG TPA: ATP-binding cassette domain-containing protein [Sediminispirochaeta sp.]|nr:ATP-binding cassette domain-containing protein [Sediminispirochaeta sp.]